MYRLAAVIKLKVRFNVQQKHVLRERREITLIDNSDHGYAIM